MVVVNKAEYAFDEELFQMFCNQYSFSFPEAFVEYLRTNNNGELEPNVVSTSAYGCYVRYFYGISDEDYSDIRSTYNSYGHRLPAGCIAIADADFGNEICMSLNKDSYGKIYFWDHETMGVDEDEKNVLGVDSMEFLADSFEDFLSIIEESPYETTISDLESEKVIRKRHSLITRVLHFFGLC